MAFRVFDDPGQGAYFVLLIVSAVVSVAAVVLRFVATSISRRKPGLEDWLAFAALVVFLPRVGVAFNALRYINGRGIELALDTVAYEKAFKMIFIADVITLLDQCFAKWSICALYYRIFSVNRVYALWIKGIAAVQFALYVVLVILQSLQCRPLNKFWQWWAAGDCIPFSTLLLAIDPLNSLIDFVLVILAMTMIRSLHMKTQAKWKLGFLFGLGGLAGVIGFIKVGLAYRPDQKYTSSVIAIWAVVQSMVSIVCCCAPIYKPLFPEAGMWSRLLSKVSFSSLRAGQRSISSPKGGARRRSSDEENQPARDQAWARLAGSSSKRMVQTNPPQLSYSSESSGLGSIHISRSGVD